MPACRQVGGLAVGAGIVSQNGAFDLLLQVKRRRLFLVYFSEWV